MTNFLDPKMPTGFWDRCFPCPMSGCWLWFGSINNKGYGTYYTRLPASGSNTRYGHRLAYLVLVGSVPAGLELDHKCRTTNCVNPDHLEPVTHVINIRRGKSAQLNRQVTHCPRGHLYDEENTILYQGRRYCKACQVIARREYKKRERSLRARRVTKEQLVTTVWKLWEIIQALLIPTAPAKEQTPHALSSCPNCETDRHARCCSWCGNVHKPARLHHEYCSAKCAREAAHADQISTALEDS